MRVSAAPLSFLLGLVILPNPASAGAAEVDRSDLEAQIAAQEYEVTFQPQLGSYQAPNRAHGFRTVFVAPGIRLVPREEAETLWEWGLTWIGYGRGRQSWPVPAATHSPVRSRMDYARGALSEWYENSPRGLKQGFVLPASPEELFAGSGTGASSGEPLCLELALTGTLSPIVAADGQSIDFVAGDGTRILRYTELNVVDARGREVRSWMDATVRGDLRIVRLVLDAADAVFPLTIDPLATSPVWTVESDQASASLGASVANAGDVDGDGFSDIVVGVPFYDGGQTNEGRVLFFRGTPSGPQGGWAYESDLAGGANLGASVGTAGDVNGDGYSDMILGAPGYDNGENNEGRVYVFLGSAQGPAMAPSWIVESNVAFSSVGSSVGTAGDVNGDGFSDVVVGGYSGSRAYVYLGSGAGLSTSPVWTVIGPAGSNFGISVGTAGDVNGDGYADIIVGANLYANPETTEGIVLVYHGSPSGPSGTPSWSRESNHAGAGLGISVGTAGDVNGDGYADVILGAWLHDGTQLDEGRAFLHLGSASGLGAAPAWTGGATFFPVAATHYGSSVGAAGDVNGDGYGDFLVAAEQWSNGQANEGRAFLYFGAPDPVFRLWNGESNQVAGGIGMTVAGGGDVNGDGYADVLVAYRNFDNGQTDEGLAMLFLGSADSVGGPQWQTAGGQSEAFLGHAVGGAGDVNGDGYADVIVGARLHDGAFTNQGRAYVFHGSASGIAAIPAWTATVNETNAYFGLSVGTAGDVNGDGYADVIVGAYGVDGPTGQGAAYVYHGSASGLSATPNWVAARHAGDARFGINVAAAGDVNRDGYADVLVAAPNVTLPEDPDPPITGPDRVYLYLGSSSGLSTAHAWMVEGPEGHRLGFGGLGAAGDVNGDGYGDVVVGAPWYTNGQFQEGRVSVYHGFSMGLAPLPAWEKEFGIPSANLGHSAGAAGDVNGDGYGDLVVGIPGYSVGPPSSGMATVYLGSAAGLATTVGWSRPGEGGKFGTSVGTAGDVNGDGYAEVIVGSPEQGDFSLPHQGWAQLFWGGGWPGVPLVPGQARSADGVPIARWGASEGPAFRVTAVGRTPFGRGKVRLETEVRRLDEIFDGLQTTLGSPTDTGVPLHNIEADLASGTPYRWRVRLRYDPVTVPFATRSRWFTVPWGGWNQTMLRTPAAPLGRVATLGLYKSGLGLTAFWIGPGSCLETDQAFALYEGTLGNFTSHVPVICQVTGNTWDFTPQAGNRYFLLAAVNWVAEGSHGLDGNGNERPRGAVSCQPQQQIAACP